MTIDVVGSRMPAKASDALKPDNSGYGQNGFGGPSSDVPGKRTQSALAREFDRVADADGALSLVQSRGLNTKSDFANPINNQLRTIGDKNVPTHPAQAKRGPASGSPGGDVPGAVDKNATENPVRQPR
jgi:hypothetical protein